MLNLQLKVKEQQQQATGIESEVSQACKLSQQIQSLSTQLAMLKEKLRAHGIDNMSATQKSITLQGEAGDKARVTWADSYRDIPESNKQALLDTFGESVVNKLWTETINVKLDSKANTVELLERMLAADINPQDYFKLASTLKPVDKFTNAVNSLVEELDSDRRQALKDILGQIRHEPKVYLGVK